MVDDLKLMMLNQVTTPGPTPGPVAEPPTFEPPTVEALPPPSTVLEPPAPPAPTMVVYETMVSVFSDDFSEWTPAFSFGLTSNAVEVETVALGTAAYKVEFAAFGNFYLSCSGVCLPTPTDPAPAGQYFQDIISYKNTLVHCSASIFTQSLFFSSLSLSPPLFLDTIYRSSILCCSRR